MNNRDFLTGVAAAAAWPIAARVQDRSLLFPGLIRINQTKLGELHDLA
jgi:hypothetical protein